MEQQTISITKASRNTSIYCSLCFQVSLQKLDSNSLFIGKQFNTTVSFSCNLIGTKTQPVNEVTGQHQKLHESKSHCVRKRTRTTSPRSAYLEDATTADNGYAYLQQHHPANF